MSIADTRLAPAEHAAIAAMTALVPVPRAACIDALQYLQANRGYVSDLALAELAAVLAMSTAELDEVATFYNLIFRVPVGQTVILLCDSVTCWMLGCHRLAAHITARLGIGPGETTKDGKYTLLPIVCLGACDRAPVALIHGECHFHLDEAAIDELLQLEPG